MHTGVHGSRGLERRNLRGRAQHEGATDVPSRTLPDPTDKGHMPTRCLGLPFADDEVKELTLRTPARGVGGQTACKRSEEQCYV